MNTVESEERDKRWLRLLLINIELCGKLHPAGTSGTPKQTTGCSAAQLLKTRVWPHTDLHSQMSRSQSGAQSWFWLARAVGWALTSLIAQVVVDVQVWKSVCVCFIWCRVFWWSQSKVPITTEWLRNTKKSYNMNTKAFKKQSLKKRYKTAAKTHKATSKRHKATTKRHKTTSKRHKAKTKRHKTTEAKQHQRDTK